MATHPLGTPKKGLSPDAGPLATAAWLSARGLVPHEPNANWYVQATLATNDPVSDESAATLLRLELFRDEWGFWFGHAGKVSWIRVTDVPFVHGRDEHELLSITPALKNIASLVRELEHRFDVRFMRESALIRTSLVGAELAICDWLASL